MAKPKKWASYRGKLPQFREKDSNRLDKISRIKQDIAREDNNEIAKKMRVLKRKKEELEEELKTIQLGLDAFNSLLSERFVEAGIQSIKLAQEAKDDVIIQPPMLAYLRDEPYSSVKDKVALNAWIVENHMEDLFIVHSKTLNSIVKERLENNEPVPPGVEVFLKTTVEMKRY